MKVVRECMFTAGIGVSKPKQQLIECHAMHAQLYMYCFRLVDANTELISSVYACFYTYKGAALRVV